MIHGATLKREILTACAEDHVGLWEVIRMVERCAPDWDTAQVRDYTLGLLDDLLSAGQIEAGFPAENGRDFEAWKWPVGTIMTRIRATWKPEKRPSIGEVAWFTAPSDVRQTA
jgi:hypothetical protein